MVYWSEDGMEGGVGRVEILKIIVLIKCIYIHGIVLMLHAVPLQLNLRHVSWCKGLKYALDSLNCLG